MYLSSFHKSNIWLFVLPVYPQVAEHFPLVTKKRHAVFPGFRNRGILTQDVFPHELETAFHRLIFFEVKLIDGAQHRLRIYDGVSFQPGPADPEPGL